MSGCADEPRASRLQSPTLEEMTHDQLRYCDCCTKPPIFGVCVCLEIRWTYTELCRDCAEALYAQLGEALGKKVENTPSVGRKNQQDG